MINVKNRQIKKNEDSECMKGEEKTTRRYNRIYRIRQLNQHLISQYIYEWFDEISIELLIAGKLVSHACFFSFLTKFLFPQILR